MDNSLPNTTQNQKTQNSNQDDIQVQQQSQQPPAQPVGSVAKEFGPLRQAQGEPVEGKPEEYIQPSGAETQPEVPVELQEHGVEVVPDQEKPNLTEHHANIGIRHAKESVPAPTQVTSSSHIQFPMTEEEALQIIKTTGTSDSKHWLAMLVEKVYEKMRFVHGKIID